MPDLSDFGGLGGLSGAAGGLGALASIAGGGGGRHGGGHGGHGHGGGGGGGLGGLGAIGMLAGMAAGGAAMGGGGRNRYNNHYNNHRNDYVNCRNNYNNHRNNHHYGGGGYHSGHGGHGGFGGGGGFGHHGFGGGYGGGYGMGGMGGYGGYGGGHHGYRGSSMRLPWMGVLAATAVAGGAAAVYPRGARSQVTWKQGSKQVSAQIGGLTVNVARAQNLKSVTTMSTQDPYVKAKLLVDGYQISEVKSGTHNNGGSNPDWTRRSNFFTFYVPSNVQLAKMAVVLEVYDSNSMSSDKMIGTCGKIPLQGIADGKMRWWTVTSGGQLQASVYSDVQFSNKTGSGGQQQQYSQQKPKHKNKDKSKKKHKKKDKGHHAGGGGGNQIGLQNEYNNYVNGMNSAGRNAEVVPFQIWASGRYRDSRSSSSSSSSSSGSSSDSDSDYGRNKHGGGGRKHGYGDHGGNTRYAVPVGGTTGASAPPGSYAYGAPGAPANDVQSANYRPPATAPSAPPAYPGATAYPQAPPPYPGAPQPQGGVYNNPANSKR